MKNKILIVLSIIAICTCISRTVKAVSFYDTVGTEYEGSVERLSELNIVSGVAENVYNPFRTVTRAEFAKIMVEAALRPSEIKALTIDDAHIGFRDIDKSEWYYKYVVTAVNGSFMQGYDDNTFKPDKDISYSEISKMVTKALGHGYLTPNNPNGWQTNYVEKMYELNLFDGTTGIKSMEDKATRGNVAVIIWNMLTTHTWRSIYRNDISGFTYMDSGLTLLDEKRLDHTYLLDATVNDFIEQDGYLYVVLNGVPYKIFDQNKTMYFSMIGGTSDVLLKRTEYPGKDQRLEVVGLSTDLGSKLITGTKDELKEEGYDLTNNKKISSGADFYYVYYNEQNPENDRVIGVNLSELYLVENIKITDKKQKRVVEDESHTPIPSNFEDDTISYRYKSKYEELTRTVTINDGELVIQNGAVLFKDNKKIKWSELKKNDLLVEVKKDRYYFVVNATSKAVILEDYSTKKDNRTITTSSGVYTTYANTKYYDYIGNEPTNFNKLSESKLKNLIGKSMEVYFDESNRVVKIQLLEDDVKFEEVQLGVLDEFVFLKDETKINEVVFIIDGKKKTYRTTLKAPRMPAGELVTFDFTKNSKSLVGSLSKVRGSEKLSDNLSLKTYRYNELLSRIKYYDEDKVHILKIKYFYDFGDYDEATSFEVGNISLHEFASYEEEDLPNIDTIAVVDKNGAIIQVFVRDYTEKANKYYGLITKIYKEKNIEHIQLIQFDGQKYDYIISGKCNAKVGDFIVYEPASKDSIDVGEKYTTDVLGYFKDLIVEDINIDSKKKVESYELNNGGLLNIANWTIETIKEEYDLNQYAVFLTVLKRDEKADEYTFSKFSLVTPKNIKLEVGDRIAINEIEGTAIIYRGYVES